ncbi:MAG: virulence factor [Anaerolineales bacterium]|nr:MAG: virulence factor [Anaerolineales bacterium]
MTSDYQIVYWRAIPAQVRTRLNRERVTRPLAERFQVAIDAAAMRSGATSTDEYLEEWHTSDWQPGEGNPTSLAERLVAQIEDDYPQERLDALVRTGGKE